MNPYWINPAPDTAEWLDSDRLKKEFYLLMAGHILLWVAALVGMMALYIQAQKTSPIEAYTSTGEPAWGKPMPLGEIDTLKQREVFLESYLKGVVEHLFMRTEKGGIPELTEFTDPGLTAILNRDFGFAAKQKGGYAQTLAIEGFDKILEKPTRRVYRLKGLLSSHSLEGSANTPIFLAVAMDKRAPTANNPTGWVVWAIRTISSKDYFATETAQLVDEVTRLKSSKQPSQ